MISLNEATRNELIRKSTSSAKGRERYNKRKRSRVASSVKEYNSIDMNKLFKDDILDLKVKVQGETDNYEVRFSFSGFLENVQQLIKRSNQETVDLRIITKALQQSLNSENVYVHCSCDDFCLHPDTSIRLLNGETATVVELKNRFDNGEDLWVFSVNEQGDFRPGKVEDVWVTKETTSFVKVTLDNDQYVITTPDHRFMMSDGSYREARHLHNDNSLMTMYFSTNDSDKIKSVSSMLCKETSHFSTVIDTEFIEATEKTPVYDIQVKDLHNFVVGAGVVLHNCYRFDYWSSVNNYNSGPLQTSNGMEIRNPDDSLGAACKHCLLVLSNANWLVKVSSTINNYIRYIENHYQKEYAEVIYPAFFDKEYEEPVQTSLFDNDELTSNEAEIDASNEEGRKRGQFKQGNTQGVRFASNSNNNINQIAMNLNSMDETEE